MSKHLSSKTMERLLAGRMTDAEAKHLEVCVACAREVAEMEQLLGAVRVSATAMAERQWALAKDSRTGTKQFGSAGWLWAACAVVMLAVGVPVGVHRYGMNAAMAPVAQVLQAPDSMRAQQADSMRALQAPVETAEADAALLKDIQNDLSTSVPQPLEPLAVTSTTTGSTKQ